METRSDKLKTAWQPLLIFTALSVGIIAVGWLYSFYHLKDHRQDIYRDLESVASLKENQINNWLSERMSDAQNIIDNPYIGQRVEQLFKEPYSENMSLDRLKWMRSLQNLKQYQNVLLLDVQGRLRMQTGRTVHRIGPETGALVRRVVASRHTSFSDFYYCTECQTAHLDVFAPVIHYNGRGDPVVGVIILRIEPEQLLYPLIQQWPVPSGSAETYLVRKEGDQVLYLTELRFLKGSAAKIKFPLSQNDLPEVMAIKGKSGNISGVDYRGHRVFAHVHNISDTPWFIIAKMDRREAEAIAYLHVWFIGLIVLMMIVAAGGIIGFLWNRQRTGFFRRQYKMEKERQALSKHYEYLTKYANDIILLLDQNLNIREANDKAVNTYGYSREKLLELNLHQLRQSDSRPSVDDQYRKVIDENGLVFETIHKRSDGSLLPVEVSARMIEAEGQKYFQTIIRDITERKRDQEILQSQKEELETTNQELMLANQKLSASEQELKQADEELRNQLAAVQESRDALQESQASLKQMEEMFDQFLKHSPVYVFFKDQDIRSIKMSKNYEQMLGRPLEQLLGKSMDELFPSDLARSMVEDDKVALREGKVVEVEEEFNGRLYRTIKFPILQEGKPKMLAGFTLDITENRKAEQDLRRSEEFIRSIISNSPIGIAVRDKKGKLLSYNQAWVRIWGMTNDRIAKHGHDIIGNDFRILFEHLGPHLEIVEKIFDRGGSFFIPELNIINPNQGGAKWVRQYFYTVNDSQGNVDKVVILTDDITDRKASEDKILTALKEKEVLLREVHHRVKNNLQVISSLLSLQSGYISDEKSLSLFKECQTRVRSMALIHERLYQSKSLSNLNFLAYVRNLVEDLFHSYGIDRDKISCRMDIDESPMKIDTAIPCGLIVNELVSNSLKYGFPSYHLIGRQGQIEITLSRKDDGSVVLGVSDNGVGLPQGFDIEKVASLGLQLVTTLVQQLDGRLEIKGGNGAYFGITFKA